MHSRSVSILDRLSHKGRISADLGCSKPGITCSSSALPYPRIICRCTGSVGLHFLSVSDRLVVWFLIGGVDWRGSLGHFFLKFFFFKYWDRWSG